jgi:NAD(P)-dependent dehydrogenase (short-subunit alcohol dehydrogenase family)
MNTLTLRYGLPALATAAAAALAYALLPTQTRLKPGDVAVITGGSRGLGLALAHRFGRQGLKLVLAARHQDELEQARHQLLHSGDVKNEDDILLVVADITDYSQAAGLVDSAIRTFGRLDCLINNAGIIEVGPIEDQALETFERTMQTNFFGALHTIYAAMPHMLGRRAGTIVNIASIGGKIPVPHMLPYVAAKFALTGFSEGLHAELRPKGIRVTTVCPGLLRSGGENHANFVGRVEEEKAWFDLGAKTPLVAAEVHHAANRIYHAAQSGRAEITITPQAWLAARVFGLAPETSQYLASLANQYILPAPLAQAPAPPEHHHQEHVTAEDLADPSPS